MITTMPEQRPPREELEALGYAYDECYAEGERLVEPDQAESGEWMRRGDILSALRVRATRPVMTEAEVVELWRLVAASMRYHRASRCSRLAGSAVVQVVRRHGRPLPPGPLAATGSALGRRSRHGHEGAERAGQLRRGEVLELPCTTMTGAWGIVVAFASAVVGGVVGWFGRATWSQRSSVKGHDNVVGMAGRHANTAGRNLTIHNPSEHEPFIDIDAEQIKDRVEISLHNTSAASPALEVMWSIVVTKNATGEVDEGPSAPGITLAPGRRRLVAQFELTFGPLIDVEIEVTWAGDNGERHRHADSFRL